MGEKAGEIKGTVITLAGEGEAAATVRKMFDRITARITKMLIEYLVSEECQEAIRKAVLEEMENG